MRAVPTTPPGGTAEDGVLAAEVFQGDEAARAGHETEVGVGELRGETAAVVAQDGGEVGVEDRGVAPVNELGQGADLMGKGDVPEAEFGGDPADALFVNRVAVAVEQADRERFDAVGKETGEGEPGSGCVEGLENRAVGGEALGDCHRGLVEFRRLGDVEIEEPRAVLVADAQAVRETSGGDKGRAGTAAFEEGVGGAGGAETDLHRANRLVQPVAQQKADSGDGRFFG